MKKYNNMIAKNKHFFKNNISLYFCSRLNPERLGMYMIESGTYMGVFNFMGQSKNGTSWNLKKTIRIYSLGDQMNILAPKVV